MEKNFSSSEPFPSHLCHTHLSPASDYKGRVGWVECEGSFTVDPQTSSNRNGTISPCTRWQRDRVSLYPPFATIILAAFLESVKQDKIAGLALPLTGEHKSQHMWC